MQQISNYNWQWHISNNQIDYLDPTQFMGIQNVYGTWWIFEGQPFNFSTGFNWLLTAKKRRDKNMF